MDIICAAAHRRLVKWQPLSRTPCPNGGGGGGGGGSGSPTFTVPPDQRKWGCRCFTCRADICRMCKSSGNQKTACYPHFTHTYTLPGNSETINHSWQLRHLTLALPLWLCAVVWFSFTAVSILGEVLSSNDTIWRQIHSCWWWFFLSLLSYFLLIFWQYLKNYFKLSSCSCL